MIPLIIILAAVAYAGYYFGHNHGVKKGKKEMSFKIYEKIKNIPEVASIKEEIISDLFVEDTKEC